VEYRGNMWHKGAEDKKSMEIQIFNIDNEILIKYQEEKKQLIANMLKF
jgi:hypothetical protein